MECCHLTFIVFLILPLQITSAFRVFLFKFFELFPELRDGRVRCYRWLNFRAIDARRCAHSLQPDVPNRGELCRTVYSAYGERNTCKTNEWYSNTGWCCDWKWMD